MSECKRKLEHYSFPDIPNFENWLKSHLKSTKKADLKGEAKGKVESKEIKTLKFRGSVKIHGTNAGLIHCPDNFIYGQGRNRLMTLESGNQFGFAEWYTDKERAAALQKMFGWMRKEFQVGDDQRIVLYGEFAGQGIHKKPVRLAVNFLKNKSFFSFACITKPEGRWLNVDRMGSMIELPDFDIYNMFSCTQFYITIELSTEGLVKAKAELKALAQQVQDNCPVGAKLEKLGKLEKNAGTIGEGIVFACNTEEGSSFLANVLKAKGPLFLDTKESKQQKEKQGVKKLEMEHFAERTVTEVRMDKGLHYLREMKGEAKRSDIPAFVDWLVRDILKEEKEECLELGITDSREWKMCVSKIAVEYFKTEVKV